MLSFKEALITTVNTSVGFGILVALRLSWLTVVSWGGCLHLAKWEANSNFVSWCNCSSKKTNYEDHAIKDFKFEFDFDITPKPSSFYTYIFVLIDLLLPKVITLVCEVAHDHVLLLVHVYVFIVIHHFFIAFILLFIFLVVVHLLLLQKGLFILIVIFVVVVRQLILLVRLLYRLRVLFRMCLTYVLNVGIFLVLHCYSENL